MKKLTFTLILIIVARIISPAQQIVAGNLSDVEGNPLSGVSVSVKDKTVRTFTDSVGRYSIEVPVGEKTIVFQKDGYQVRKVKINKNIINIVMTKDEVNIFNLTLKDLMDIKIVTASKFSEPVSQTPATVVVLSYKDLINRGYTCLSEILNDIPGFDIAASYGDLTQLAYARGNRTGSYNERTMLMIDGIEANILYAQNMNISSDFPLTAIERIEIIYGPASAVYGPNVFSGIINVITKSASDLDNKTGKVYVQSGAGSNNTQFAEITYLIKYNPVELSISYRRFKSDMFSMVDKPGYFNKELFGNSELWGPYTEYYPEFDNRANDNALLSKIKIKNIELGYNHLLTKHGHGSEYPYDKTLPTTNWKFKRDILFLKYNKEIGTDFKMSFLASYQKSGSTPDNIFVQGWNDVDSWNSIRTVELLTWKYVSIKWSLFQDFEYQPLSFLKISGGVKLSSAEYQKSYELGRSDQTIWLPGTQWAEPAILFPQPASNGKTPGNTFVDTEWGGFIQSKILLFDHKFSFVAGLRYDKNEIYGEIFSPRIGAAYKFTENLTAKACYGTGFQSPAPRNLYGSWGGLTVNKDLKPDRIQAVDLNLSTNISNFGAEVTLFSNVITNSIMQGENLPTKNIFGLELKMNYILVKESRYINNAHIHFNYSYVNAKYKENRINTTTGRTSNKIGDIAPHKFNIILSADVIKYLHFNIRMNYVDKRSTVISNPVEKTDAFFVTNLNFQVINLFKNKLRIFFNVNNIFDEVYFHPGMDAANAGEDLSTPSDGWYSSRLPQAGRSFMGGIYLTF